MVNITHLLPCSSNSEEDQQEVRGEHANAQASGLLNLVHDRRNVERIHVGCTTQGKVIPRTMVWDTHTDLFARVLPGELSHLESRKCRNHNLDRARKLVCLHALVI